jgi:AcrR family transcriptional regulator
MPQLSRPRAAIRRDELLAAADRVVMRQGPAASMNTIAAEAGITKPILYKHFGDKGGLYHALAEHHIADLLAELRAAIALSRDPRVATGHVIDTYLRFVEERPQVYRFLMHRAQVEEPQVRGQVALFITRVAEELAAGILHATGMSEANEADRDRALTWSHGIVGMVQAAGDWWLEEQRIPRAELVGHLTALLGGGLLREPPADSGP